MNIQLHFNLIIVLKFHKFSYKNIEAIQIQNSQMTFGLDPKKQIQLLTY